MSAACVRYLEAAGWRRDGQDRGVWIDPEDGTAMFFSSALHAQFATDGVSMLC